MSFARQFVVPLAAVVFFGVRDDGSLWGLVFLVPLLIVAIWRQLTYRYEFASDSLVLREGWLFRNVRRIDYKRIENIDTERGPLHRLLNVAEVRIESSTGGRAEAQLRVLGLDAVDELRERIFEERSRLSGTVDAMQPATAAEAAGELLLHLQPGDLLRYGLIDNRGLLLALTAFGVVFQQNVFVSVRDYLALHYAEWIGIALSGAVIAVVLVGAGLALLVVTQTLSIAWAVVTLYDFKLTRHRTDLRLNYGLLTRVALTLRLPRIQAVRQTRSLLHRFFGRVAIAVDMAGDGFGGDDQSGNRNSNTRVRWLAPICTNEAAAAIIRAALPMLDHSIVPTWQPLAPGARARIFRKTLLVFVFIGAAPAIFLLHYWAPLLLLPFGVIAWWRAVTYTDHTRWALTRDAMLFRSGWLKQQLHILPRNRVQSVKIHASPFDRRHRMATLIVDTAGAHGVHGPMRIAYLEFESASRLAQALYRFEAEEWAATSALAPR